MPARTVEIISHPQDLLSIGPAWNRVVEDAGIDHPFVRHEWVRTWWECFGGDNQLRVLLVREGGEPVGIVPLMLCQRRLYGLPVRQLELLWNAHAGRSEFVIARDPRAVCEAALDCLARLDDWDLMLLEQVATVSPCFPNLPRLAGRRRMRVSMQLANESPYMPLNCGWEAYYASLSRKHRANLRNREKRLRQHGALALEVVSSPEALEAALEDGFRLEAAAWKGAAGSAINSHPRTRRFYSDLARRSAPLGTLRLCFLTLEGRRIAFAYMLECANKLYLIKSGYDHAYAAYSPSMLLRQFLLRDGFDRRVRELDFLGISDSWKLLWTPHVRTHYTLYVFAERHASRALHWAKFRLIHALGRFRALRTVRAAALHWRAARAGSRMSRNAKIEIAK